MSLINPIKTVNNFFEFISAIDAAFGVHTSDSTHYIDDAHSLGFQIESGYVDNVNIYIGSSRIFRNTKTMRQIKYAVSKNKNALYMSCFYKNDDTSYNNASVSIMAAKASSGKWNVFFKNVVSNS